MKQVLRAYVCNNHSWLNAEFQEFPRLFTAFLNGMRRADRNHQGHIADLVMNVLLNAKPLNQKILIKENGLMLTRIIRIPSIG